MGDHVGGGGHFRSGCDEDPARADIEDGDTDDYVQSSRDPS
jgi:hypothetical protein